MFEPAVRAVAAGPHLWLFLIIGGLLGACSGDPGQVAVAMQQEQDLTGTMWQVEDIDAGGTIENSQVTIEIPDVSRISGSAGCNRYVGSVAFGPEDFRAAVAGSSQTIRSCAPAIDEQERRFLAALIEVRRYVISGTVLQLFDEQGRARIRAVAIHAPAAEETQDLQDAAGPAIPDAVRYTCDKSLVIEIRFMEPDTLGITLPDGVHVLKRDRQASGARYAGDGLLFWDNGGEALLDIGGVVHRCSKE